MRIKHRDYFPSQKTMPVFSRDPVDRDRYLNGGIQFHKLPSISFPKHDLVMYGNVILKSKPIPSLS